jgi:drug/metabolite transporter (DMT)-like permease
MLVPLDLRNRYGDLGRILDRDHECQRLARHLCHRSGVSLGLFALAAGASWVGRGREPERTFGNTLQQEVRRSLALVDYQLSVTRRWIIYTLGIASLLVGVALFSWTLAMSQDNFHRPDSSGVGWFWYAVVLVVLAVRTSYKVRDRSS